MTILGINPGLRTGKVLVQDSSIIYWAIDDWQWVESIAWMPGTVEIKLENKTIVPDRVYIEIPYNPEKCSIQDLVIAGIYLAKYPNALTVNQKDWLLALRDRMLKFLLEAGHTNEWSLFWNNFAPQELCKNVYDREYKKIKEQLRYECVRDAALIALYGELVELNIESEN